MKSKNILRLIAIAFVLTLISWGMAILSYSWLPPQAASEAKLFDNLIRFSRVSRYFYFLWGNGNNSLLNYHRECQPL